MRERNLPKFGRNVNSLTPLQPYRVHGMVLHSTPTDMSYNCKIQVIFLYRHACCRLSANTKVLSSESFLQEGEAVIIHSHRFDFFKDPSQNLCTTFVVHSEVHTIPMTNPMNNSTYKCIDAAMV